MPGRATAYVTEWRARRSGRRDAAPAPSIRPPPDGLESLASMSAALVLLLSLVLPAPLASALHGPLVSLLPPAAASAPSDDAFDLLDADGSGTVSREEFEAVFEADGPDEDPFAFFDTNGDGAITPAELAPMAFETFEEQDS